MFFQTPLRNFIMVGYLLIFAYIAMTADYFGVEILNATSFAFARLLLSDSARLKTVIRVTLLGSPHPTPHHALAAGRL